MDELKLDPLQFNEGTLCILWNPLIILIIWCCFKQNHLVKPSYWPWVHLRSKLICSAISPNFSGADIKKWVLSSKKVWCSVLITTPTNVPKPCFLQSVFGLLPAQAFEGYRTKATLFLMFSQTRYIRIPHLMWILTLLQIKLQMQTLALWPNIGFWTMWSFKENQKEEDWTMQIMLCCKSVWSKILVHQEKAWRVVTKDWVGSCLVLELLQEPASNFEAARSMISISSRKGRK